MAARSGVSIGTVSRALNGRARVSDRTRERVHRVAGELGYRPDEVARHLVTQTTTTVAMVVPDITNPFFPELVDGVHRACQGRGHALMLLQSPQEPAESESVLEQLAGRRLAGVVLVGGALPFDAVTTAVGATQVVVVDRASAASATTVGAAVVRADHRAGAQFAGDHLAGLGHSRLVHVAGPAGLVVTEERVAGFRDALTGRGVELPDSHLAEGDFNEASGYEAMRELLARHPDLTGVFAANDLMAIGAVRALDDAGVRVPRDVSVVGYDDIHLARYVRPALTTVRQPVAELGRRAVARLLDDVGGDGSGDAPDTVLPVELVVRGSTAPIHGGL
ncbi:LacI family DNA-binding transcriptional regulator [Aeromicrobium sp. CF4.19]|uniref:LacI family DNA-binding transcriptional regulator n=1 Tax=Aeromicrobium sp. CF4.19 TaxID=3373082 RepID=UPI003EE80DFD